jgi:hypothetical protein
MHFREFIEELQKYKIDIHQEKIEIGNYFSYSPDIFIITGVKYKFTLDTYYFAPQIKAIYNLVDKRYITPKDLLKTLTNNVYGCIHEGVHLLLIYNIEGRSKIILRKGTRSGKKRLHYIEKFDTFSQVNDLIRICCQTKSFDKQILKFVSLDILQVFGI